MLRDAITETMARIQEIAAARKEPEPTQTDLRPIIIEALTDAIGGDAYDCTRVWSAWSVGTMSNDDFVQVVDRVEEIADAVMAAIIEPIAKVMGEAAVAEHEAAVATGAQRRALRDEIAALIEEAMVESTVDYPAGHDAGHRVEWDDDRLLDGIMAAVGAAPATPSVSVESEERKPWPKGCIGYMPDYQAAGDCVNCGRVREDHAEFAAPAPNPSPAAKSGEAKLRKLAEAAAKVAPGPWEAEGEETEGACGKYDEFVILDAQGRRLCGTENADHTFGLISEENDGDGGHYQWNEPASVLMHFIAACDPATILSLLATPSPQPADAVREALDTVALSEIDALFKRIPSGPYQADARGEGWEVRQIDTDPTNDHHWPFRLCSSIPGQKATCDEATFAFIAAVLNIWPTLRAALTEPAPAGEAVEPVAKRKPFAWVYRLAERYGWEFTFDSELAAVLPQHGREVVALYARAAPEDTARLREDLANQELEVEAIIDAMDLTSIPRQKSGVWFGMGKRIEMLAAERDDARKALIEARTWHEAQDKALSKSGRGDGDYYWSRTQHQRQIAEINAALKVNDDGDAEKAGAGASGDGEVPANISP